MTANAAQTQKAPVAPSGPMSSETAAFHPIAPNVNKDQLEKTIRFGWSCVLAPNPVTVHQLGENEPKEKIPR